MSSIELVRKKAQDVIMTLGRSALHAMSPDDFEYYSCTLELVDSHGVIENILHFPVMPNSISINRTSLVNIKKSGLTYISQFQDTYVGQNISIAGTFGRKFRLLITNGIGGNINDNQNLLNYFDLKVKTGYGALKLLEKIIESSQKLDDYGNPKILFLYNHSFNQNVVIEVLNFQVSQSLENNMIWNFSIDSKSLAPADSILFLGNFEKHLMKLLAVEALNKSINDIFSNINVESITQIF